MRRPVKPFVTEYKGNARRPPSPSMKLEEDMGHPRSIETSRFVSVSQGEDSYEAALRAADALFSGQSRETPSSVDSNEDDSPTRGSSPSGGRILRVIDEAPAQELVALEAERAPKRRGRKPGSKNKPKSLQTIPADMPTSRFEPSPALVALMAPGAPVTHANLNVAVVEQTITRPALVATGARRGERYAWVRTQLKPGQSWKRDLPKVIW